MQSLKPLKKVTTVKIPKPARKSGWDVTGGSCNSSLSEEDIELIVEGNDFDYFDSKSKHYQLALRGANTEFCCGVIELGELVMNDALPQKAFNDLMSGIISYYGGKTIIINTNGSGASLYWEQVLSKCPYFTNVKTFKNPSSGKIIKIWISRN